MVLTTLALGGTTVWAAHVVDLLARRADATVSFRPAGAAVSLAVAVSAAAGGAVVARRDPSSPWRLAAAGAVFGSGAWLAETFVPGAISVADAGGHRPLLAALALVLAVLAAMASLVALFHPRGVAQVVVAAGVSAVAWSSTHLTAVAATRPPSFAGVAGGAVPGGAVPGGGISGGGSVGGAGSDGFALGIVVAFTAAIMMIFVIFAAAASRAPGPPRRRPVPRPSYPLDGPEALVERPLVGEDQRAAPVHYSEMDTVELPTLPGMAPRPSHQAPRGVARRWYRIRPYAEVRSR
jgi:hypothetical protein